MPADRLCSCTQCVTRRFHEKVKALAPLAPDWEYLPAPLAAPSHDAQYRKYRREWVLTGSPAALEAMLEYVTDVQSLVEADLRKHLDSPQSVSSQLADMERRLARLAGARPPATARREPAGRPAPLWFELLFAALFIFLCVWPFLA